MNRYDFGPVNPEDYKSPEGKFVLYAAAMVGIEEAWELTRLADRKCQDYRRMCEGKDAEIRLLKEQIREMQDAIAKYGNPLK